MTSTLHEQIAVIERQIVLRKAWTDEQDAPAGDDQVLAALKDVAKDLRGRMEGRPSQAALEIGRRVDRLRRTRSRVTGHYDVDALIDLAEQVLGRWPTVRQALEKFEGGDR